MYHEKPMLQVLRNRQEEDSIFHGVQTCLGHTTSRSPETISRDTALSDIAEDSMERIEVVFEVEEWAKTNMDDALYDQIENVGDLVDAIVYGKILPRENSVPAKSGWRRFIPPMHLRRAS